jgi:hypothetical protein
MVVPDNVSDIQAATLGVATVTVVSRDYPAWQSGATKLTKETKKNLGTRAV